MYEAWPCKSEEIVSYVFRREITMLVSNNNRYIFLCYRFEMALERIVLSSGTSAVSVDSLIEILLV